jgi:predicted glycosyltransferase
MMTEPRRLLIWVQHLLGVGHLMRAAQIARAFDGAGWAVDFLSGGPAPATLALGGATLHQLPPLRAADAAFSGLRTTRGTAPADADWAARGAAIADVIRRDPPDAILVEHFPFGRRPFRPEIEAMLDVREDVGRKPYISVSSVRDVLVARKPGRAAEAADLIAARFDRVLVHGDPALIPFGASFPCAERIAGRLHYTGYIGGETVAAQGPGADGWDEIVVSAGGGAVGAGLIAAALDAAGRRGDGRRWRVLVGHAAADTIDDLRRRAPASVTIEPARRDFRQLLANCAASASQAGYNTVVDLLQARARAVLVPFAHDGETEQTLRAETLAEHGLAQVVAERALSGAALNAALDTALAAPRGDLAVRLDGEAETVRCVAELVAGP